MQSDPAKSWQNMHHRFSIGSHGSFAAYLRSRTALHLQTAGMLSTSTWLPLWAQTQIAQVKKLGVWHVMQQVLTGQAADDRLPEVDEFDAMCAHHQSHR